MSTHRHLALRRSLGTAITTLVVCGLLAGPLPVTLRAASQPISPVAAPLQEVSAMPGATTTSPELGASGGLTMTLSNGAPEPQAAEAVPVAPAQPLDAAATQAVLDRLPPLEVAATDTEEFKLPPQSLPPPTASTIVTETFPPPAEEAPAAPETAPGTLAVLRYAPEGEIPVAPFLNVTFSQPMVPLGTVEQLTAADVPVQLTPEVPGTWKWLGTQTLSFEYGTEELQRFPMATLFTATVPAGTTSAVGGVLEDEVSWTFRTPPPTVVNAYPQGGPQRRDPVMFVSFNQQIDSTAVLATIAVLAGGQPFAVRPATPAEIAADGAVSNLVKNTPEGRWVAFRAEEELPADTTVTVNIGPGTPSAEGPLTTEQVQSFSFVTYAALRIVDSYCWYGGGACPPGSPFTVRFNNPLDAKAFAQSMVTAQPAISDMQASVSYDTLQVWGATQGRTTYQVTVSGAIRDIFGQTLGKDQTLTFQTGDAEAYLTGPNQPLTTLDPSAPSFSIYTINYPAVRVRAYAVTPDDWLPYLQYLNEYYSNPRLTPPGKEVLNTTVEISSQPDTLTETNIDLSPIFGGKPGQAIVLVDAPPSLLSSFMSRLLGQGPAPLLQTWMQSTDIGLDAFVDSQTLLAWTTSLADGTPLADVSLELPGTSIRGTTGADGLASLELTDQPASYLVARLGDDTAILPRSTYYWAGDGWVANKQIGDLLWYVFDDRQMYRPGEEVHVKGWVRRFDPAPTGGIGLAGLDGIALDYTVMDPVGNAIANGTATAGDLGGFDFAFTVPENSNLGYANVQISARDAGTVNNPYYYHSFQIQEFRRPEFEVTARNETTGPYFLRDNAVVAVSAQYYAGGPLPNADTTWTVTANPGSYVPPGWDEFTFGIWEPWWGWRGYGDMMVSDYYYPGSYSDPLQFTGRTDATGNQYLRMDFLASAEPRPYTVNAEASVMDVNRQTWAASTSLLVHPAELYVGLRSPATFVEKGDPLVFDVIVTDVDGKAVAEHPVDVRAVRKDYQFENGSWVEVQVDEQVCEILSAAEPVTCTFATTEGGQYLVTAQVRDDAERLNRTQVTRWVSGGPTVPSRDLRQQEVQLVPDKQIYEPGDVAKILVQAPIANGSGLLTVNRGDMLSSTPFTLDGGSATLEIPIEESYIPNLNIQVDVTGSTPRLDDEGEPIPDVPEQPAYAAGSLTLDVSRLSRTLDVQVTPAATKLDPGASSSLDIRVVDAAGNPVEDAELAVVVVDEAILALTNYQLADPVATFYAVRGSNVSSYYGRSYVTLASPQDVIAKMAQTGGLGGGGGAELSALRREMAPMPTAAAAMAYDSMMEAPAMAAPPPMAAAAAPAAEAAPAQPAQPIAVRTNFDPLALFAPDVRTDADGFARVDYTLPDNLTRYRVMVVAATEQDFGKAETNVTARLPLMVRPSAPRFLNFGDRFELPVVLQNQTDEPLTVDVAVNVANLVLADDQGKQVEVPANDRVEVRFATTTENVGTARAQIGAAAGSYADAAAISLPVYTPATTEAFATYGTIDEGSVAQPLLTPTDVFPQFGGLQVSTSSTILATLTDAVLYLQRYPFECSEQLAARIMSVASLRDVLTAFQAEGLPPPEEIDASMKLDIARLQSMQNYDGGFPYWTYGQESIPYNSVFVAHALAIAQSKDYAVPPEMLQAALDYLRNIEGYYPSWYGPETRHALSSYAVYVRQLLGDVDYARARSLLAQYPLDDQSLEALAWLWQVLATDPASTEQVAEIRQHMLNNAVETAGAANFFTSYGDDDWVMLHSNRRTDAIVLDAFIEEDPTNDLIPKVVRGLMAGRTNGHWLNTQENVFGLVAMDNYFNTFEQVTPDFVARVWLGDAYVAEHEHRGRSTDTLLTTVPMAYLMGENPGATETQDILIAKDGDGRLYYRLGLDYAPTDLKLDPLEMGFVVQRSYEAVDDPEDVYRDEEGVWHIKNGARVRVRLTMVAPNRRYHVALVDRLPAGLEIINPDLAVSESVPPDPQAASARSWWWWGPWYEHQNLRDAGAEAFTSYLWDGVYDYTYVTRATTPGDYVVPPAKAEEMYAPEVFGRTGSDRVVVE
jgi:hypothetical protein